MAERTCPVCGASLAGKRPHAVYCSRSCKSKACHARIRQGSEKERQRNRARYLKERERRIAQAVEYARRHPEKSRLSKIRRRSLKAAADINYVSTKDWTRLVRRFEGRCAYCGASGPLHMDHIVPLARGGRHGIGNLLPACASCNCS